MRKDILVESVRKRILQQSAVTQDSLKFAHPRVVEDAIEEAYNEILKTFYASNTALMNAELDFFAKKWTVSVAESNGEYSITLPARPIELRNNLGIRYVRAEKGKISLVRTTDNELETLRHLESYCCSGKAFYYLDGNKIIFDFPQKEYAVIEKVVIKMLPQFSVFEDSDNIEFPMGEVAVIARILETMGYRPTDNTNDDVR